MAILKTDNYNVYIDEGLGQINKLVEAQRPSKVFLLVDENTEEYCLPLFRKVVDFEFVLLRMKSGEVNKNLESCEKLWKKLLEEGADRHSILINLGGGVPGDLGGYGAASYMRGFSFVQVPTTLLAQVDASIGAKVGVNFLNYKNLIGSFTEPSAVIIETSFLNTLPKRQMINGFAEVVKHALISSDELWSYIIDPAFSIEDSECWHRIVQSSVAIKRDIVAQDLREGGLRKILNFGHTIGHALESFYLKTRDEMLHGEAIAHGMIAEAYLSHKHNGLPHQDFLNIKERISSCFEIRKLSSENYDILLDTISKDKKNRAGAAKFSLLNAIGQCDYDIEVSSKDISAALDFIN